ncbi:MAG: Cell division protein FtsN [Candidatus Erwinia impunctatus]|nr:Cell division protein FtsN [Culicoides impunctatus]
MFILVIFPLSSSEVTVAQRDYVGRSRSNTTPRKKSTARGRKKSSNSRGVPKVMVALAVAAVFTFIGGLWFLTHHKKEESTVLPTHQPVGNGLPPKPEERWSYIKELENRQIGVPVPREPSTGDNGSAQAPLTDEQRQLLAQMQADMRQQPTQLNEVPWNGQALTTPQQSRQPPAPRAPEILTPRSTNTTVVPNAVQSSRQQNEAAPENKPKNEVKEPTVSRWMVQCGSFKNADQAESVRAQLAFEGFESRIASTEGWKRVVIGPFNSRTSADSTLKSLRNSGHTNCIPLASGG